MVVKEMRFSLIRIARWVVTGKEPQRWMTFATNLGKHRDGSRQRLVTVIAILKTLNCCLVIENSVELIYQDGYDKHPKQG